MLAEPRRLMSRHQLTPEEWRAIEADPEFQRLKAARRRFALPATDGFVVYYFALPVLVGYAPDAMARPVVGNLNWAYLFALSQFAMTWLLMALYIRRARAFDRMAARIIDAVRTGQSKVGAS
jgi:uncharacterized membrane protein (DUF485 family)